MSINEILKLSVSERILLVETIWDSIESDSKNIPVTDEQMQIVEKRLADYKKNPSKVKSWDKVKRDLLAKK